MTKRIADLGCEVIGVDSSEAMIQATRALSVFDAVFSNAALHWMKDPDRVIGRIAKALRPNGRFVAEMGGHGCVKTVH